MKKTGCEKTPDGAESQPVSSFPQTAASLYPAFRGRPPGSLPPAESPGDFSPALQHAGGKHAPSRSPKIRNDPPRSRRPRPALPGCSRPRFLLSRYSRNLLQPESCRGALGNQMGLGAVQNGESSCCDSQGKPDAFHHVSSPLSGFPPQSGRSAGKRQALSENGKTPAHSIPPAEAVVIGINLQFLPTVYHTRRLKSTSKSPCFIHKLEIYCKKAGTQGRQDPPLCREPGRFSLCGRRSPYRYLTAACTRLGQPLF